MNKELVKIPKLEDILAETPQTRDEDKLTFILNQPPKESWLRTHPLNSKVKYLPIERIEWLLSYIFGFGGWEFNVIDYKLVANSICVAGRLTVKHPLTGEKLSFDGTGAWALQTEKGASAMDITKLNSNAVMLAFPAAKSECLKDAAHLLGNLFGASANRAEKIAYDSILPKQTTEDELRSLYESKKSLFTPEECKNFERILDSQEKTSYEKMKNVLLTR